MGHLGQGYCHHGDGEGLAVFKVEGIGAHGGVTPGVGGDRATEGGPQDLRQGATQVLRQGIDGEGAYPRSGCGVRLE